MRAALYRASGSARDVLEVVELEVPEPGPGEVRVKIAASGINPTDWKSRAGLNQRPAPESFQIPHHDGAGHVDALGPGVTGLAIGQRVWLYLAAYGNRYGTAATYAVVPAERAIPLPSCASDELGACLGVPAVTAAHCLGGEPARLQGSTVLVAGGAGAVGHYAIELAKHGGARVITTVSSAAKAELARNAGADLVLNYRTDDVVEQIRNFTGHVDRIVEVALGANIGIDAAVAGPGTVIAVYAQEDEAPRLPTYELMAANITIRFTLLYTIPPTDLAAATAWTAAAVSEGALSPLPITTFGLADIVAAHLAVEAGTTGKVIVYP